MKGARAALVAAALLTAAAAAPAETRHLLYLHGRIIQEQQSARPESPKFGFYELEKILGTFRDRDFVVSGDIRPKSISVSDAADKVAQQVRALIATGVPADRVTVVGASMGASIALLAATRLQNPEVRFGILGACLSESVRGLLADDLTEPCPAWAADTAQAPGLRVREIVVSTGLGHGFLYRPLPEWVDPVVTLASAARH